jgi:uncharacterized membrane protein
MTLSKGNAFIIGMVVLVGIFVAMFFSEDHTQYGAIITGVVSLTTLYMGANVADHAAKGAFFNQQLHDKGVNGE